MVRHEIADFVCTTNGSSWNVVFRMVSKHSIGVLEGKDYRTGSASEANIYEDLSYRKENLKCRLGKN